jgi:hypothetical protein
MSDASSLAAMAANVGLPDTRAVAMLHKHLEQKPSAAESASNSRGGGQQQPQQQQQQEAAVALHI